MFRISLSSIVNHQLWAIGRAKASASGQDMPQPQPSIVQFAPFHCRSSHSPHDAPFFTQKHDPRDQTSLAAPRTMNQDTLLYFPRFRESSFLQQKFYFIGKATQTAERETTTRACATRVLGAKALLSPFQTSEIIAVRSSPPSSGELRDVLLLPPPLHFVRQ
jgi:hypothetical protein